MGKMLEINRFEYNYLKDSLTIIEMARKNGKEVWVVIREHCHVNEEAKQS